MYRQNIEKFYEKVNGSEELQKELKKRDSEYAKTHDAPAEGASEEELMEARKKAFENIVLPVAKEQGLDFTVDELIEYEKEKLEEMDRELDNTELHDAAGGYRENYGIMACLIIGVGAGGDETGGFCFTIGGGWSLHWLACVFWA